MPLISLFSLLGRFAGDLLTSTLGWASRLLFGRVPRSHQVMLVLMMAGSILWVVVILGLLIPGIMALLLSSTPHPGFMNAAWLGVVFLFGLILLPLGIGLGGYLVPSPGQRLHGLAAGREILRGYLFAPTLSALLVFLAGVALTRKLRNLRHGWSDAHVPIVVSPGGYEQMLADLQAALADADLEVHAHDAPWVLTLPAQILSRVAGDNIRRLRPDRLVELTARDLRIGLYPAEIAISGSARRRTRARSAIMGRLATTSAHLTTSAEAQAFEDQLGRLAKRDTGKGLDAAAMRAQFQSMDAKLSTLLVSPDEWDTLFRIRLQIERDLLVGDTPGTKSPSHDQPAPRGAVQAPVSDRPSLGRAVATAHDQGPVSVQKRTAR